MTKLVHQNCLAPEDFQQVLAADGNNLVLIDVRSPEEYMQGHIPGAINIPVDALLSRMEEITKTKHVVTVCWKGGGRSEQAAEMLKAQGYNQSQYLCGGTAGWMEMDKTITAD